MTCKDCDRQIVCRYYTQWANVEQIKTDRCQYFKSKSDYQEVKHGYWHLVDNCANAGIYCSVCNKKVYKTDYANQKVKSKYCPNCGAKMDGGKNE